MNFVFVKQRLPKVEGEAGDLLIPEPAVDEFKGLRRFDWSIALDKDAKTFTTVKDGAGQATDYLNVQLRGYLSTFEETTRSDRQGDYVVAGAFKETIPTFMANNPVMLKDHVNMTDYLVGTFTGMVEDARGLYVEGTLSNRPGNKDIRFLVAEGMLKTLSMGGLFHYKEDGRGIFKVDLWEGSLTPIPANPDARFIIRSLNSSEKEFVKCAGSYRSYNHFLQAKSATAKPLGLAA